MIEKARAAVGQVTNGSAVVPTPREVSRDTSKRQVLQIGLVGKQVGRPRLTRRYYTVGVRARPRDRVQIVRGAAKPVCVIAVRARPVLGPSIVLTPRGGDRQHRP